MTILLIAAASTVMPCLAIWLDDARQRTIRS